MFICTVDIDLAHHIECNSIFFFNMSFDLFVGTRFLTTELVAWESQYWETTWFVLFVHVLKLWVMVFGVPSFGRNIDYNSDTAFIGFFEVNQVTIDIVRLKTINSNQNTISHTLKVGENFLFNGTDDPCRSHCGNGSSNKKPHFTGLVIFKSLKNELLLTWGYVLKDISALCNRYTLNLLSANDG